MHFDDRRGRYDATGCMLMPRGAARWRPKHALMQSLTRSQSRLAKPDLVMSFHWADARLVNEFPYLRLVGRIPAELCDLLQRVTGQRFELEGSCHRALILIRLGRQNRYDLLRVTKLDFPWYVSKVRVIATSETECPNDD